MPFSPVHAHARVIDATHAGVHPPRDPVERRPQRVHWLEESTGAPPSPPAAGTPLRLHPRARAGCDRAARRARPARRRAPRRRRAPDTRAPARPGLVPVSFPVAEFVRNDMRLEQADVPEDGHVAGQDIAGTQRKWHRKADQREAAHFRAGSNVLPGDAGDVIRQVPLDGDRRLAPRDALEDQLVVEAGGEDGHLPLARLARHGHEMAQVGAELPEEDDAAESFAGRASRAPRCPGKPRGSPPARRARWGGAEQEAGHQRSRHQQVHGRHRPVGSTVRDPDLVHRDGHRRRAPRHSPQAPTRGFGTIAATPASRQSVLNRATSSARTRSSLPAPPRRGARGPRSARAAPGSAQRRSTRSAGPWWRSAY